MHHIIVPWRNRSGRHFMRNVQSAAAGIVQASERLIEKPERRDLSRMDPIRPVTHATKEIHPATAIPVGGLVSLQERPAMPPSAGNLAATTLNDFLLLWLSPTYRTETFVSGLSRLIRSILLVVHAPSKLDPLQRYTLPGAGASHHRACAVLPRQAAALFLILPGREVSTTRPTGLVNQTLGMPAIFGIRQQMDIPAGVLGRCLKPGAQIHS